MSQGPEEDQVNEDDLELMTGGSEEDSDLGRFTEREIEEGDGKYSNREV